jgi:hypothetical protein
MSRLSTLAYPNDAPIQPVPVLVVVVVVLLLLLLVLHRSLISAKRWLLLRRLMRPVLH